MTLLNFAMQSEMVPIRAHRPTVSLPQNTIHSFVLVTTIILNTSFLFIITPFSGLLRIDDSSDNRYIHIHTYIHTYIHTFSNT